jgi:penicillin-binding protein 1A
VARQSQARGSAARRRRSPLVAFLAFLATLGSVAALIVAAIVAYNAAQLPPIDQLAIPKRPPNIAILAEDGTLLANRGDTGGAAVKMNDLPSFAPKAFVAIEDRRFYSHFGIDALAVLRALTRNASAGTTVEGGSTLTQQLAKNLFLTQERTVSRKIQEAILALWLEQKYSKDQILELYLNRVYFGSGSYGIEAAARRYFGHGARNLTLPEAALLAGLMKAPSKLAPNKNPAGATERAAQVVAAMVEERYITADMGKLALARPAQAVQEQGAGSVDYAADYVMDVLDDTVGAIDEDIAVTTTLDATLQNAAERALTEELDRKGTKFGVGQGAIVALDPNGAIKALVGGRDYAASQFNRAVAARRQPGSAFKPFVFLAALEQGLTPDTLREDGPINVKGWRPENYTKGYFGPVTLTKALSLSLNTVAVRLGLEVGPKAVVNVAHRLGIASDLETNPSIALGTSEVTPLEIVTAYVPFANGGIGVQPRIVQKVRTARGKLLYQRKGVSNGRVIDPTSLAMMNRMMVETLLTGTARKGEVAGWQAAGKTGTSQDWRDAWFIGYTSHLVAGVWLGNDDSSPTKKATGGGLPVEVWSRFMQVAHRNVPPQPLPGGLWQEPSANPFDGLAAAVSEVFTGVPASPSNPGGGPANSTTASEPAQPRAAPHQQERAAAPAPPIEIGAPPGARPPPAEALRPPAPAPGHRESRESGLLPPAPIPNNGDWQRPAAPPPRERNPFEQLFGG